MFSHTGCLMYLLPLLLLAATDDYSASVTPDCSEFTLPKSRNMSATTFGKGRYVSVGAQGTILISQDLKKWSVACTSLVTDSLISVAFSGERFVAVGEQGVIITSDDGLAWVLRNSGTKRKLNCVIFAKDQFVAVGDTGTILTATDGITWEGKNRATNDNHLSVAYGNQLYIISDNTHHLLLSTDQITWTAWKLSSNDFISISFGNSLFVAAGGNEIVTSSDGKKWTSTLTTSKYSPLVSTAFGNDTFRVIQGVTNEECYSSTDGIKWGLTMLPTFCNSIAFCNDKFIATANGGYVASLSTRGSWEVETQGGGQLTDVCYGNGFFVAVGPLAGEILYSRDGVSWTSVDFPPGRLTCTAFGNNTFIAAGDSGLIYTSTDCINWNQQASGTTTPLYKAIWGKDRFVIVGQQSYLGSSPDGVTWNWQNMNSIGGVRSIAYGNGRYVISNAQAVNVSTDLVSWQRGSWPLNGLDYLSYANGIFIGFDNFGAIKTSDSGLVWPTLIRDGTNLNHGICCLYNDGLYLVGHEQGGISFSSNLTTLNGFRITCQRGRDQYTGLAIAHHDKRYVSVYGGITSFSSEQLLSQDVELQPTKKAGNFFSAEYRNGCIAVRIPDAAMANGLFAARLQTPSGRTVYATTIRSTNQTMIIPLHAAPPGLYIFSAVAKNGKLFTAPVMLSR